MPSLEAVGEGYLAALGPPRVEEAGLRLEQERAGTEGMEVISKSKQGASRKEEWAQGGAGLLLGGCKQTWELDSESC